MDRNVPEHERNAVLLVEDNADHADLIKRCLSDGGVGAKLYHVRDGEEALDFLEHRGRFSEKQATPRPSVIFMDLRLPRLDGLSLLRTIKNTRSLRSIPVVVLSTSNADPDIKGAYEANANAYLTKPLNFDEFSTHLQMAAKFWLKCNRTTGSDRKE